jgi:hypothetical protein
LLVLALLVSLESNFLLLCGCDTILKVLDVVGTFDVHLMVYDPSKHIIGCHHFVGGVLVDQGNHIVLHWSIGPHQAFGQHAINSLLGS